MEVHFFAEVDASGAVVSLEEGALSDIPDELLALVGKLVTNRLFQASFLWLPEGRQTPCRVQISQSRSTDEDHPSVYVFGDWEQQIPFGLTARELDVLTLIALGLQSSAIAEQFTLSPRTVTTHIDRIMRKLGVQNRVAAAVLAVDGGLIRLPYPGKHDQALELLGLGRSIRDTVAQQDASPKRMLKPMKIGAAFPLHGPASADGAEMARASRLAVEELNARGGIDGRKVELEIVDVDVFETDGIRTAFETLVARGADVLTSGYHAHQDLAHEFAADAQIPYLHAATMDAMAQRVRDDPDRYATVFQVCPSDSVYAPRFVEMMTLLRDRGSWRPSSRRLTVVQSAWAETDLGMLRAADIAERDGWDLSLVEVETGQQGGWSALAHQLSSAEPAAVMIGNYFVEDAVAFLDGFLQDPGDTLLYTLYSPSVPEFRRLMGDRVDGLLWATASGTYSDSYARAFAGRYRDRFGVSPGRSHAGIAYDRVGLIAHAWRYADNPRDPLTVANELRQVIYRGVNGVYYFGHRSPTTLTYPDGTSDPSLAQAHLVFQIQGGHQRIIDPAPYADGEFVLPSWMRRKVLR